MGGENRVLTAQVGTFPHRVVGEPLHLILGGRVRPCHLGGELTATPAVVDGGFEEVPLVVAHFEAGDRCSTHVLEVRRTDSPQSKADRDLVWRWSVRAPPLPTRSPSVRSLRKATPRCEQADTSECRTGGKTQRYRGVMCPPSSAFRVRSMLRFTGELFRPPTWRVRIHNGII